jgi:hypothetical protein
MPHLFRAALGKPPVTLLRHSAAGFAALTLDRTIGVRMASQMQHHTGRRASASEIRSWERSLPVLAQDRLQAGLDRVDVPRRASPAADVAARGRRAGRAASADRRAVGCGRRAQAVEYGVAVAGRQRVRPRRLVSGAHRSRARSRTSAGTARTSRIPAGSWRGTTIRSRALLISTTRQVVWRICTRIRRIRSGGCSPRDGFL